jgi:hypothetical protein
MRASHTMTPYRLLLAAILSQRARATFAPAIWIRYAFALPRIFNEIVRRIAKEEGAVYVPVEEAFTNLSAKGIPGFDLMLEHVHPNSHGYALMGRTFFFCASVERHARESRRLHSSQVLGSIREADGDHAGRPAYRPTRKANRRHSLAVRPILAAAGLSWYVQACGSARHSRVRRRAGRIESIPKRSSDSRATTRAETRSTPLSRNTRA